MLRKLLKHEFRATARVMIPLYLITVLLAVLTRATALWAEMVTFDGMLGRNFLALLSGIIIFGFVLALIATFVVAVILAILRFRSNLMADEGYVMFTLPVSTHTLVWSKLIVSAVWFLGAVVVDVLSLLALVANVEMFWELGRVFQEIADQWPGDCGPVERLLCGQRRGLPGGVPAPLFGVLCGRLPGVLHASGHRP